MRCKDTGSSLLGLWLALPSRYLSILLEASWLQPHGPKPNNPLRRTIGTDIKGPEKAGKPASGPRDGLDCNKFMLKSANIGVVTTLASRPIIKFNGPLRA